MAAAAAAAAAAVTPPVVGAIASGAANRTDCHSHVVDAALHVVGACSVAIRVFAGSGVGASICEAQGGLRCES